MRAVGAFGPTGHNGGRAFTRRGTGGWARQADAASTEASSLWNGFASVLEFYAGLGPLFVQRYLSWAAHRRWIGHVG